MSTTEMKSSMDSGAMSKFSLKALVTGKRPKTYWKGDLNEYMKGFMNFSGDLNWFEELVANPSQPNDQWREKHNKKDDVLKQKTTQIKKEFDDNTALGSRSRRWRPQVAT